MSAPAAMPDASVDPAEVAKFGAMAEAWWDPAGAFAPLHHLNPTRIAYIRDRLGKRTGRSEKPLLGLAVLDIGCGGGLLSEPMARLGARVTGIDPSAENIAIAERHAAQSGLDIDYRVATAESLAAKAEQFDVVLAMEIIEHMANRNAFLEACAALVADRGELFLSTLNRTAKAYVLAIVGAEYILRWLPRGTHDWRRFVRPSEIAEGLRHTGLAITEMTGVHYNPLFDRWSLSRDLDVNYMIVAARPKSEAGAP